MPPLLYRKGVDLRRILPFAARKKRYLDMTFNDIGSRASIAIRAYGIET